MQFLTHVPVEVEGHPRVLCIKQLVHESFPYCASFRFDNPQCLEIVVDCLHKTSRAKLSGDS